MALSTHTTCTLGFVDAPVSVSIEIVENFVTGGALFKGWIMLLLSIIVTSIAVRLVTSQSPVETPIKQAPDYLLVVAIFLKQCEFNSPDGDIVRFHSTRSKLLKRAVF